MKKTLIAIAALAAALVGCQQYGDDQIVTNESGFSGKTFRGYFESESRLILDADSKANWEAGELVSVFAMSSPNVKYTAVLADGKTQDTWADFEVYDYEGNGEEFPDFEGATYFDKNYAAAPYNDNNSISVDSEGNATISIRMESNLYDMKAGSIHGYPYVAQSDDETFMFKQVSSLVRIRVYKTTGYPVFLNTLKVSSLKGNKIAGNAIVDMSADNLVAVIADDADATNEVTLHFGEGQEGLSLKKGKANAEYVYVPIPKVTFEGKDFQLDFTYTYINDSDCKGTILKDATLNFEVGKGKTTNIEITGKTFHGGVNNNPVATVNGVQYITLEEAFTEAIGLGGAQTISMLSPAVVENAITIPNGSDITLILNGNEVTSAIEGVLFTNNGKMTITDGTITAEKDLFRMENGSALTVGAGATLVSNTDAVIYAPAGAKNITINIIGTVETKTTGYAAIQTNATTEYPTGNQVNIVEGAVVKSENTVALYCPGSQINIAGGEITGYTAIYHKKGELNIAGGTLTATGADRAYQFYGNGCVETGDALVIEGCEENSSYAPCVLNITGGKFVSTQENTAAIAYYKQSESAKAVEYTITGGSFSSNPAEFLTHDYRADFNGETNLFDVVSDVVVKIGENEYTTLAEAVADAEENATLELLGDNEEQEIIFIDKNITIDGSKASAMKSAMRLNSNSTATAAYTIKSSATRVIQITEPNVKVTLKNLNIVSTAKRDGTNDVRGINIHTTATEGVELTLENVNVSFEPESGKDWAYAVNVTNTNNHTIYIKGGTYEGANNINIWGNNHTVTVEGATLKNTYGPSDQYCGVGLKLDQGSGKVATLNNVTFSGTNAMLWEEANLDANTITIDGVRQVNGDKQLEAALTNWNVAEVNVNVLNDVTLNIGTGTVFGGDQTTAVNIEGNGKTLTFEDTYRTYVKSKGVLTLNNLNISRKTSSTNTHWHDNNMKFCTPVVMNEVTFDKGICLDGAQTFELNKVTINKSQVGTYALWIVAGGDVTLNDLTINATADGARGIKIGDEDAGNKEALTKLTINGAKFDTKQKAAILVSSKGGAEIVAQNLDIEKVAADQIHAVWVDEDWAEYYDLVTVTGCLKWVEGDIEYVNGGLIYRKKADLYEVYNADGLFYIAKDVNTTTPYTTGTFTGKLVKLMNDIDLKNAEWIPIGDDRSARTEWEGIFDGQNYTISNFQITQPTARDDENKSSYGFFGNVEGTVKNLTIKNANVDLTGEDKGKFAAALVGRLNNNGLIDNCHVVDSNVAIDNWTVGGIVAQVYKANITNSTITNSTISGYAAAGAVAGIILGDVENTIENCKVENCEIVQNGSFGYGDYDKMFGVIAGALYSGAHTTYFNNNQMLGTNTINGVASDLFLGYFAEGDKAYVNNRLYIAYGVYLNQDGAYELENVSGLKWLANEVNGGKTFDKETVRLMADLNLNNEEWEPIGNSTNTFQGTFDGNNYTISNLLITGNRSNVGLFGFTNGYNGTIKNLTVNNAKVSGRLNVAVVAGTPYTTKYENIKVTGHVEVNGMSYVGAVGGKNAYTNWKNITVDVDDSSYVKANSIEDGTAYRTYVGGVIGFTGEGNHSFTNITSNIDVIGTTCDVGGIAGIAQYGTSFINCSSSGDVTITDAEEAGDAEQIGGIAGVWNNANDQTVTFENCSYTGTLKTNITSDVKLDNNTIVGDPYSTNGQGTLVLNGLTRQHIKGGYVWLNKTDGGVYELENRDALYWFANEVNVNKNEFRGETVKLMTSINLAGKEWTPIGVEAGERYSGLFYGTFDGNGKAVTNFTVNQPEFAGFFGRLHNATVKNLSITRATINSNHYAGAICAWAESGAEGVTIENCRVYTGTTITSTVKDNDNGDKVGGILGYAYKANINNCRVYDTVTIQGYRDMGGIVGSANGGKITNCRLYTNVNINVDNTTNYKGYKIQSEYNVGEVVGRTIGTPVIEGNTVEGVTINWGVIPPYLPGGNFGGSVDGEDINW